jgi:predicted nuclease with TOPRIM domain
LKYQSQKLVAEMNLCKKAILACEENLSHFAEKFVEFSSVAEILENAIQKGVLERCELIAVQTDLSNRLEAKDNTLNEKLEEIKRLEGHLDVHSSTTATLQSKLEESENKITNLNQILISYKEMLNVTKNTIKSQHLDLSSCKRRRESDVFVPNESNTPISISITNPPLIPLNDNMNSLLIAKSKQIKELETFALQIEKELNHEKQQVSYLSNQNLVLSEKSVLDQEKLVDARNQLDQFIMKVESNEMERQRLSKEIFELELKLEEVKQVPLVPQTVPQVVNKESSMVFGSRDPICKVCKKIVSGLNTRCRECESVFHHGCVGGYTTKYVCDRCKGNSK